MEKRLVLFIVLSVLILSGHVLIQNIFFPPPREVVQQDDSKKNDGKSRSGDKGDKSSEKGKDAQQRPGDDSDVPGSKKGERAGQETDAEAVDAAAKPSAKAPQDVAKKSAPDAEEAPAEPVAPEKYLTLGSMDAEKGFHLLVTLSNRGAAIERVELVERDDRGRLRYRDLDRPNGYLGMHVGSEQGQCVVQVVGLGTPAALAVPKADKKLRPGFQVGDAVISADEQQIVSESDLEAFLARTKPGQEVTFQVKRGNRSFQLVAKLTPYPLQLIQPETPVPTGLNLKASTSVLLIPPEPTHDTRKIPSCLLGLHSVDASTRLREQEELVGATSLRDTTWMIKQSSETEVVFSKKVTLGADLGGGQLEFTKRYKLAAPVDEQAEAQDGGADSNVGAAAAHAAYHLQMDVEIRNLGSSPRTVSYVMDGPNGLPVEGWWYTNKIHPSWGTAGARDVVWRVHGSKHSLRSATQIYKEAKEAAEESTSPVISILTDNPGPEERTLDYLGVDTQYFSAVLLAGTIDAPKAFTCQQAFSMPVGPLPELSGRAMKKLNTTYRMVSAAIPLEPGKSVTDQYHLFLGPKKPTVLAAYDLPEMIEYGWFGKIAKPLSWLLHLFYTIVRNYGLAIVLLTVLVRGAMFPIGRKAARNAQMMQELAPEIKKIKEKYKNDLEKQGQAQRELWKKHNFNPLSGCWLMFLQLPIFIGLYRCLSVDINLRQAPLIPGIQWCSNLAGPDMAWRWQGYLPDFLASEVGWLGPYLNILPIVTIILFIAQQKMFTPPATDEQTQMQQKMMKYMMVFMGVLFFKVPAGLCVYFVASSLWGIGERKLLPKPGTQPAKPDKPKKPSLLERLQKKEEIDPAERARQRRKRRKRSQGD